jgi:hypothetical protein
MNSFVDVNFKFDISVGVSSFENTKFESSICHINYQLFFDTDWLVLKDRLVLLNFCCQPRIDELELTNR